MVNFGGARREGKCFMLSIGGKSRLRVVSVVQGVLLVKKVVSLAVAFDIDLRVAYLLITLMHCSFLWGRCLTRRS